MEHQAWKDRRAAALKEYEEHVAAAHSAGSAAHSNGNGASQNGHHSNGNGAQSSSNGVHSNGNGAHEGAAGEGAPWPFVFPEPEPLYRKDANDVLLHDGPQVRR